MHARERHPTPHSWALPQVVYALCETRRLRAPESDQTGQRLIAEYLFPGWPPNQSDLKAWFV